MWIIIKKELLELVRDRKNLLLTVLLPVLLMPLLMFGMVLVMGKTVADQQAQVRQYHVIGELPENIKQALDEISRFEKTPFSPDFKEKIKNKKLDFAIEVKADEQFILYVNQSEFASAIDQDIRKIFTKFNDEHLNDTLKSFNVIDVEKAKNHFNLDIENMATDEQFSAKLVGGIIPFIIMMMVMVSALATSSDLAAGEKERGTIETLMASPMSKFYIVFGKWLAITFFGLVNALLTMVSMFGTLLIVKSTVDVEPIQMLLAILTPLNLIMVFMVLIPSTMLVTATLFISASFAKSFKESQSYGSMVMLLVMMPMTLSMQGNFDIFSSVGLVPILNINIAITEWLAGQLAGLWLLLIMFYNFAIAAILLFFAVGLYKKESILERQ